jgi:hypothetical protein
MTGYSASDRAGWCKGDYRFGFWNREVLMIWSIWREVNVLVPFRSDPSPMTLKTSGAASLT